MPAAHSSAVTPVKGAELALGFAFEWARRTRQGYAKERPEARRRSDRHQADRHRLSACGAHAAQAKSRWLFDALAHMVQSNRAAAEIIQVTEPTPPLT